jgi:hypothetical protein
LVAEELVEQESLVGLEILEPLAEILLLEAMSLHMAVVGVLEE